MNRTWQSMMTRLSRVPVWLRTLLAATAFLIAIALAAYRAASLLNTPGQPKDDARWALGDFRDAIYYPVVAFLHGDNPYDRAYAEAYPVYGVQAPYSPFAQIVHAPLGLLPYEVAEWVYFALSGVLMLVLAWLTLRICGVASSADRVLGLAALIAVSRSGHIDLVLGQMSLQLVIAALVALHFARRRPWLAGLGLGIVSLKPTFAVPMAWLMFCRRDYRAVFIGTAVGTTGALAGALVICGGIGELPDFVKQFGASYQKVEQSAAVAPATAWSRVDAMTVFSHLPGAGDSRSAGAVVAVLCLTLAGLCLAWQTKKNDRTSNSGIGADDWSGVLICVVTLVCCYHMVYDALLLTVAVVAVSVGRHAAWRSLGPATRWALAVALALPLINYLSARTTLTLFNVEGSLRGILACSSAMALLIAWGLLMLVQLRCRARPADAPGIVVSAVESGISGRDDGRSGPTG